MGANYFILVAKGSKDSDRELINLVNGQPRVVNHDQSVVFLEDVELVIK